MNAASLYDRARFYVGAASYLVPRQRVHRDQSFVSSAYDEHWSSYAPVLEQAQTLADWLSIAAFDRGKSYYNHRGRLIFDEMDSVAYYRQVILSAIEAHFPGVRSVTEYGCGVGRNVLKLCVRLASAECYGYELSAAGVELARRAAHKFGLPAQFSQLDYLRDGDEKFVFPKTDIAFTSFSLEQLPERVDVAVARILSHVTRGTIHLEPVAENYPWNLRGILGRFYSRRSHYVKDLPRVISSIKGVRVFKQVLDTSHNALMYPSLYVIVKS